MAPRALDSLIFKGAQALAVLQYWMHTYFGINIRGLGWLLHQIRSPRPIEVEGVRFAFRPSIASSYGRMVAGIWNEPETHLLLTRVLARTEAQVTFIDVGANVGEIVVDVARQAKVSRAIAFEPIPECVEAIRQSCSLNRFSHVEVRQLALSDQRKTGAFISSRRNAGQSSLSRVGQDVQMSFKNAESEGRDATMLETSTLDTEFGTDIDVPIIILLDVEGEELNVLRGGSRLIERSLPLVIFEYNHVSRARFSLGDIRGLLGNKYDILRLRSDGFLDRRFEHTWNCVATPITGPFAFARDHLLSR